MGKGMWTKHVNEEGKVYFYNAAQNRSVWQPPPESVVHEAHQLKPTLTSSAALVSREAAAEATQPIEEAQVPNSEQAAPAETEHATLPSKELESESSSIAPSINIYKVAEDQEVLKNNAMALDFQARIDAAMAQKQKELAAKRFGKKRTLSEAEGDESKSAYLRQKSELEKMAGVSGDDSSKWLVR